MVMVLPVPKELLNEEKAAVLSSSAILLSKQQSKSNDDGNSNPDNIEDNYNENEGSESQGGGGGEGEGEGGGDIHVSVSSATAGTISDDRTTNTSSSSIASKWKAWNPLPPTFKSPPPPPRPTGTTNGDENGTHTNSSNDPSNSKNEGTGNGNGNNDGASHNVDLVPSFVKKPEQQQPPEEQSQEAAPNATINNTNSDGKGNGGNGGNSSNTNTDTNQTAPPSTATKKKKKKGLHLDAASAFQLEQQVQMEMNKNELAYQFLACRQFWIFTIPQALLTMISSVLAFMATSELFSETTKVYMNTVVGATSGVVVFLQTMSGLCLYGSRAAMHNAAAISLRNLRDDLIMIKVGSAFEAQQRQRMQLANKVQRKHCNSEDNYYDVSDDNDWDDDKDDDTDTDTNNNNGDTFSDMRIRFKQCQAGLQSVVPMAISDAFHTVDSYMMLYQTQHNFEVLVKKYGACFNESTQMVMYFKAYDILVGEFLESPLFPFFIPKSSVIVATTIKKLRNYILKVNSVFEEDVGPDEEVGEQEKLLPVVNDI